MADEEVVIKVKVDSEEAGKSLKSLRSEYKEQQKELDNLTVGTKEYVAQLKKLGAIKDEIGDLNTTIKAFSPEGKIQAFSTVISGVASGFQAASGAVGLFGASTEGVQKALLKVQSAMAFSEGIKGIMGLGDGFKDVIKLMQTTTIGQKAVAVGQKVITAAQWLWNAAMDANPIGAIIAAIALLITGIVALTKYFMSANAAIEAQTKAYNDLKAAQDKQLEQMQMQLDLMAIRKAKASELAQMELDIAKQKTINDKNEVAQLERMNDLSDEQLERKNELYGIIKKDYENQTLLNAKLSQSKIDEAQKEKEAADKLVEENKAKRDKESQDHQKYLEEKANNAKQFLDKQIKDAEEQTKIYANLEKQKTDTEREFYASGLTELEKRKFDIDNSYNDELAKLKDLLANKKIDESDYIRFSTALEVDKSNKLIQLQKDTAQAIQTQLLTDNEAKAELNAIKNDNDLQSQIAVLEAQKAIELNNKQLTEDQKALISAQYREKEEKLTKESAERKRDSELQIASQITQGLQSLSDLYFTVKKSNLKKGSAEEKKAAKEQFEINKKLSLVSATITGIQSVISAYNAGSQTGAAGVVLGPLMAVIAGIAAATNIAKISSSTFDGGASSPSSDGGGSASAAASAASAGVAVNNPTSASTLLNADGTIKGGSQSQNNSQRVYVVESDITEKQGRVSQLQENAKI